MIRMFAEPGPLIAYRLPCLLLRATWGFFSFDPVELIAGSLPGSQRCLGKHGKSCIKGALAVGWTELLAGRDRPGVAHTGARPCYTCASRFRQNSRWDSVNPLLKGKRHCECPSIPGSAAMRSPQSGSNWSRFANTSASRTQRMEQPDNSAATDKARAMRPNSSSHPLRGRV